MPADKHQVGVIIRALMILSLSALVMAIALALTNLQDALLIFVIVAPLIAGGISLIFAKLGIDSLFFSRNTVSAICITASFVLSF